MTMRIGSRVSWQTSQGKTSGKTVEKKTADFTFEGQRFTPADDDPYWIVVEDRPPGRAPAVGADPREDLKLT